jgi:hypothetical protein
VADCIQISEAVYQRVRGRYEVRERGAVKGKGEMTTWFLCGPRRRQNCTLNPTESESATVPVVTELPGMGPAGVTRGPLTELSKMW